MKETSLENSKQIKYLQSHGYYSISKDEYEINTELPDVTLTDKVNNNYRLKNFGVYNISSVNIPCFLVIYKHEHPTHRQKLDANNRIWDKQTGKLSQVIPNLHLNKSKVLIINMHDEDFSESELEIYCDFVKKNITFNEAEAKYVYDCVLLRKSLNDSSTNFNEEPRTCGGGVLDPI